jgi:hypothetical protein
VQLQNLLNRAGIKPRLTPNGNYSRQTATNVKAFQKREEAAFKKKTGSALTADGDVGPQTALALRLALNSPPVKENKKADPSPTGARAPSTASPQGGDLQSIIMELGIFVLFAIAVTVFGTRVKEMSISVFPPKFHIAFHEDKDIRILDQLARIEEAEAIKAAAQAHRVVVGTDIMKKALTRPTRYLPWRRRQLPGHAQRRMIEGRVEEDE